MYTNVLDKFSNLFIKIATPLENIQYRPPELLTNFAPDNVHSYLSIYIDICFSMKIH